MTREELRARIRSEVERQGYAVVPEVDLWAAFAGPGEDDSVPFNDALRGFAVVNGWEVRGEGGASAGAFTFRPARHR